MPEIEITEEQAPETPASEDSSLLAPDTPAEPAGEPGEEAPWLWSDGQPGEGDRPEWLRDKYSSVEAQAQAYGHLEGRLGGFTGAPEGDYELRVPEGLSGELLEESALRSAIDEVCKTNGASQTFYNQLTEAYLTALAVENTVSKNTEMEALGADGPQMVKDLQDWGQANLPAEDYATMQALCTSAAAVKFFQVLTNKVSSATPVAKDDTTAGTGDGLDEARLHALLGDPKWVDDPIFQAETMKKFKNFYGEE